MKTTLAVWPWTRAGAALANGVEDGAIGADWPEAADLYYPLGGRGEEHGLHLLAPSVRHLVGLATTLVPRAAGRCAHHLLDARGFRHPHAGAGDVGAQFREVGGHLAARRLGHAIGCVEPVDVEELARALAPPHAHKAGARDEVDAVLGAAAHFEGVTQLLALRLLSAAVFFLPLPGVPEVVVSPRAGEPTSVLAAVLAPALDTPVGTRF